MKYLYPKQVLYLYREIIACSGGSMGLRDNGILESAIYHPQAAFGGEDLYPDIFSKAGVLIHSIISNHPFIDGNKRVGFEAMRLLLRINGYDLNTSIESKFAFVMQIAASRFSEQAIADWLKKHNKSFRTH